MLLGLSLTAEATMVTNSEPQKESVQLVKKKKNGLPGIVSDIDGVVLLGKKGVEGSKQALEKVLRPNKPVNPEDGQGVPFFFFTNSGGYTEDQKSDSVNQILGLDKKGLNLTAN